MKRIATLGAAIGAALMLAGCAALGIPTPSPTQPLTQAQLQQDLASVNYLFQATGCTLAAEAATAAPIVKISADATGNQILQAIGASGALLCQLVVPPSAVPVPAPANAPAASTPLPATAIDP